MGERALYVPYLLTMHDSAGFLDLDGLTALVSAGQVDTVVLAMTDMQGRLQGKRFDARFFLDEVVTGATEGCNYLLAVDVEMRTVGGYEISSWDRGYGDFVMRPDTETLRLTPWQPGTALCLADVEWHDAAPVRVSPRQVLRAQVERLKDLGLTALTATELEFIVFSDTYEQAWSKSYRGLVNANQYNVDYSVLGTSRVEPLIGRIRTEMAGAAMVVESSKGECNPGQSEIAFRYSEAIAKADEHVLFKTGAKEIAAQEHCSLTFMAKFDEREGSSCHIHMSLRDSEDAPAFAGTGGARTSSLFEHFLAGQIAGIADITLLLAPNVNSYKRFVRDSFAPTAIGWGYDNRTCAFRVIGHGESLRIECRVPGADVNPYLALAGLIAAGIHGIEAGLELGPQLEGNAYLADAPRIPTSLAVAAELFSSSNLTRSWFGDDVVDHYLNMARVELEAFGSAVTDWERFRCFERM
jgi:glutamine synthetase